MSRRIGFLGFDGLQALDLFGPSDAFRSDVFLNRRLNGEVQAHWPPYDVVVIGLTGRRFTTSSGIVVKADRIIGGRIELDTLVIPGGSGLRRPGVAEKAASWITAQAPHWRRIASICTGIYALGPTGLLDGRRVSTHWTASQDMAHRFPKLRVDPNALYIKDGKFVDRRGRGTKCRAGRGARVGRLSEAPRGSESVLRAAPFSDNRDESLRGPGHVDSLAPARRPVSRSAGSAHLPQPPPLRARV